MEQLNPSFPLRTMPPSFPPGLGNPTNPPLLASVPFAGSHLGAIRPPVSGYPSEQDQKKKEFSRGVFVSGFEKCVTTAMIQHHFSIKPIHGLKHPMTKFRESKGFAFIYYGSEDDALYVKKTLDRTAILKDKIRITRTVISENLSKMMFKLKTHGLSEKEIQENEAKYFNDENLEKEVERIIKPLFGTNVQVNKITIPHSKADKKPLRYARVFFYVSDVKEAKNVAEKIIGDSDKNQYEKILTCISDKINSDETFGKYARSQIYEYTKKNQSNVLHLKGIKHNPNEDPTALAEEIKEFMQKQGPQWNIVNAYASPYQSRGAWANLTFSTYEQTIQAYEQLKTSRPKFRDNVVYGSLRNVKDARTVVISVVRKDVTEKDIERFLNELAAKSVKTSALGDQTTRKYDYFSFNIIQSKKFFKTDGDNTKSVTEDESNIIQPSWIEINEVPRRLIIHFFHQFSDEEIKELNNDITVTPGYENIFMKGDSKKQLRLNHQKGHVNKDGVYIKHTEIKGKKKVKQNLRGDKPPRRNLDMNNPNRPRLSKPIDFAMGSLPLKTGAPKLAPNFAPPGFARPPAPIGGHPGAIGVPSLAPPFQGPRPNQPPSFNPPQPFVGTNMPPPPSYPFKQPPPSFLPPGAPSLPGTLPPPGILPGKMLPPQPGQFPPQFPFKAPVMQPPQPQPPAKE